MTSQTKNDNLNYLIDPTFSKVNKLFGLLFEMNENENENKDSRISSFKYYLHNIETKILMY